MPNEALIKIFLPNSPAQISLWAQIIFLCILAKYIVSNDAIAKRLFVVGRRGFWRMGLSSLILIILIYILLGFNTRQLGARITLCLGVALFAVGLPLLQTVLTRKGSNIFERRTIEVEIMTLVLFVLGNGYIIAAASLRVDPTDSLFLLPISSGQLSFSLLVISAVIFLLDGGTRIVRGVLDRTGTIPNTKTGMSESVAAIVFSTDGSVKVVRSEVKQLGETNESLSEDAKNTTVDTKEYNRGKYIGNLERLLILVVVLVGSYETIGFIIAGKGLIRAKEFENRDFAEYFLIGTLTSTSLAIAVGLLLKFAMTKTLV